MIIHIIVSYDQNITLIMYVKDGPHVRLRHPPRENWFQYVRRVYATAINFPRNTFLIYASHIIEKFQLRILNFQWLDDEYLHMHSWSDTAFKNIGERRNFESLKICLQFIRDVTIILIKLFVSCKVENKIWVIFSKKLFIDYLSYFRTLIKMLKPA